MPGPARTVEEISGTKRIVREYDASGRLLRIVVQPLLKGGAGDLPPATPPPRPPATRAPPPPPAPEPAPAPRAPEPVAPPPPPSLHVRFPDERAPADGIDIVVEPLARRAPPPAPAIVPAPPVPPREPEPVAPPAPAAFPVRVRFEEEDAEPGTVDVVVAPLAPRAPPVPFVPPILVEAPADEPVQEPAPVESVPLRYEEPEALPEPEPAPEPAHPVAAAEEPKEFEILAIESLEKAPTEPEPEPVEIHLAPEPVHEPPREFEPDTVVTLAEEPAPEPEPTPEPEPATLGPPYLPHVPDLDERVDALLARTDMPPRRRKRAPIPAPVFPPLAREPWEDRLDAALAR